MVGGAVATGNGIGVNATRNAWMAIFSTVFAAFGGILIGYTGGVISGLEGMTPWMCTFGDLVQMTECNLSLSRWHLIVFIPSAGAFLGALFAAPIADLFGRRWSVVAAVLIFTVGVSLQLAVARVVFFVVGRLVAGLGVGMVYVLIPLYQAECAPEWIRGAVIACSSQSAISFGSLIAAFVTNATKDRIDSSSWKVPISIQFVWGFVLAVGMIFLPESPRWLIMKERGTDAAHALSRLISLPPDHPELQAELDEIRLAYQREQDMGKSSYSDCFHPARNKILLRTLTGILLQVWLELTGLNFVTYYSFTSFFDLGKDNGFQIGIIVSTVLTCTSLPGIWGVEKFGRRRLLLIGAVGMCIVEFAIAIYGLSIPALDPILQAESIAPEPDPTKEKVFTALVFLFLAILGSTWGPISSVIPAEIFPLGLRAKALSLSVASYTLCDFGSSYAAYYLIQYDWTVPSAGLGVKVFFIWAPLCIGSFLFAFFCVPETKGLSLEEIDFMYQDTNPMHSASYRRRIRRDAVEIAVAGGHTEQYAALEHRGKA